MIKIEKKEYIPPAMVVTNVEMENGISSSSASINTGNPASPNTPQSEIWNDRGSMGDKNYDL
ncbi:hypothetical protein [Elizabethkingia ursingii]|uniref:hypothetical protein n=1 Tax=Elizabethkingia ursingii TaxID=1756150 RepID=UPI002012370C|nr:hypothetical protein [Elizabethkingia ursingii]MCL1671525.1 hypothetical protein [Elizabethkingia ursingii]